MPNKYRNALTIILLTIGTSSFAQKQEEAMRQAPIFSVSLALITIIVLFLGIIVQKRWKD